MKSGMWLALAGLVGAGSAFAQSAREAPAGRFEIESARLTAEPSAAPGQRFALSATVEQREVSMGADLSARFVLKGGPVVPPGACGEIVFRDGFE